MSVESLKRLVCDVPGFPKEGIIFKDITPVLQKPEAFRFVIDEMCEAIAPKKPDYILGIESRGFIFSPVIAYRLGCGFIPVRKQGKLPRATRRVSYALEYGEAVLEMHEDALRHGERVVLVDDLLATGGTAEAAARLVEELGGRVEMIVFLIELGFLKGRDRLNRHEVFSLLNC